MLSARGKITNVTGKTKWAVDRINEFNYRKTFGLSKEEYMAEPVDDIAINNDIMGTIAELERAKSKQLERRSK